MKIGLVVSESRESRSALKLGLELDERIASLGLTSDIIDLQDDDVSANNLLDHDVLLLITQNEGQLYNLQLHQLLLQNRVGWNNKKVGSVIVSDEKLLAESADLQLKNSLRSLGVRLIPEKLIVIDVDSKFDKAFNLTDSQLNLVLYRYIHSVLDHGQYKKSA